MNTIKIKHGDSVPNGYTGIVEWESGTKIWFKNGKYHKEDGPAYIRYGGYNSWYLDGKFIWNTDCKHDLTNEIILSKTQHPSYPTIQIWKILDSDEIYELTIIPGMEGYIQE